MRTDQTQASVRYVAAAVLLLLGRASQAQVSVSLPFADGYESGSLGLGWSSTGTAAVVVQTANKIEGSFGCTVTNNLSLDFDSAKGYTNVWVQIYAKPSPVTTPPSVGTNVTCAFYVGSDGSLRAYSNSSWKVLIASAFPTGSWIGFAVHLDYKVKRWDLYYTEDGYATPMAKANPRPLDFNATAKDLVLNGMSVSSQRPVHLDQVIGAKGAAGVTLNSPTSLVVQTMNLTTTRTMLGLLGNRFPSGENTLTTGLGRYLMSLMVPGDKITVRINGANWDYTYDPPGWDYDLGAPEPDQVAITPGMAVWLTRTTTGTIYGFGGTPNPGLVPPTVIVKDGNTKGWNQLAWPRESDSPANTGGNRWGFNGVAEAGDRIYVRDPDTGVWHILTWNSTLNAWMEGRNQSTFTMRPGLAFWYYKRLVGSKDWQADAAQ